MNKLLIVGLFFMFGCGSLAGHFFARMDLKSSSAIASQQAAEPVEKRVSKMVDIRTVKPTKNKRELLEEQYRLCIGESPNLAKLSDATLFQIVTRACTEKS